MGEQSSEQVKEPADRHSGGSPEQTPTQKPEPDEKRKEAVAER